MRGMADSSEAANSSIVDENEGADKFIQRAGLQRRKRGRKSKCAPTVLSPTLTTSLTLRI
jgi:hypothetical protein